MVTLSGGGMHTRRSAQLIIEKLLNEQSRTPPRTRWERIRGRSPLGAYCKGWYLGALGEIAVGDLLKSLAPEWAAFHALPIGLEGWDIDQVLVGPGGVVTINAKNHTGQRVAVDGEVVTVDGRVVPYLRHAEFEGEYVTDLLQDRRSLTPLVHSAVVFTSPGELRVKAAPGLVTVVDDSGLEIWLRSLPVVLDKQQRENIVDLFDNPAMWANVPVDTGDDLLERFAVLDAEIRTAERQRRLIFPLTVVLACGVPVAGVAVAVAAALGVFAG